MIESRHDGLQGRGALVNNPYDASRSTTDHVPAPPSWAEKAHLVVSVLIGLFCALQFLGVWFAILEYVTAARTGLYPDPVPYVQLAHKALMPFTLALAGVFLAFRRRLSVLLFAAYILQYAIEVVPTGRMDVFSLTLVLLFLAYALWRWKSGRLTGWPGGWVVRSAK